MPYRVNRTHDGEMCPVSTGHKKYVDAVISLLNMIAKERDATPNNPTMVQSGPNAMSLCIGVNRISEYEVVEDK